MSVPAERLEAKVVITNLDELPAILTPQQVADVLQIPVASVYDHGESGRLPRVKLGRTVRFSKAALIQFIERGASESMLPSSGM